MKNTKLAARTKLPTITSDLSPTRRETRLSTGPSTAAISRLMTAK